MYRVPEVLPVLIVRIGWILAKRIKKWTQLNTPSSLNTWLMFSAKMLRFF
ncbi:MAG: hypothetical protein ABI806_02315 [Candidatus Solibacter sp.]